jgi:adenine-specific DNA-methyltransferase
MNYCITNDNCAATKNNIVLKVRDNIPHLIKYMGSKKELIDSVVDAISENYHGETICDLFAGSSILSGAIGTIASIHSNDIQEYSAVFARTYLGDYTWKEFNGIIENTVEIAQKHVNKMYDKFPKYVDNYGKNISLSDFTIIEKEQQSLIRKDFKKINYFLFTKYYSGTYWSFDQCAWIDGLRLAADMYKDTTVFFPILSSLMYAMAYNSQSTGHYAQYRDAYDEKSMNDILSYRLRGIKEFYVKKLIELIQFTGKNKRKHTITSLDYRDCLNIIKPQTIVYADPPYVFVHYSRFYHALETLVKYDYPDVLFKGRYRSDRHQSPFCRKTEVVSAFNDLFEGIAEKESKLVLSYSDTGMIKLDQIIEIAKAKFGSSYSINKKEIPHKHSTMGRFDDKNRHVTEYLITFNPSAL